MSGEALRSKVADLSPERRALLERLLTRTPAKAGPGIPRRTIRERARLSSAQQRIWLLEQLAPAAYNEAWTLRLGFAVDLDALRRTVNEIARRHEILRTTFLVEHGGPVQVIGAVPTINVPVVDLASLPETLRDAEVQRLSSELGRQPFDLSSGPLFRTTLVQGGPKESFLLVSMHHIAYDGWSTGVFTFELAVLYTAFAAGQASPLPELPVQYGDYAEWQHDRAGENGVRAELDYWSARLADLSPLRLPTTWPRPKVPSGGGAREAFVVSERVQEAMRQLAHEVDGTPFMCFLAAFQTLLHRYTGQSDIVVGVPVAGRTRRELEGLIGLFVNTVVVRTDCSGDPPFRDLVRRVRETTLGAYAHQEVAIERVVEEFRPVRDGSVNPLFQVVFQLFTPPSAPAVLQHQILPVQWADTGTAKFDLRMDLLAFPHGIEGYIEYRTDLFDVTTVRRMLGHFITLLEGVATEPGQRLSALPLLTEPERRLVLGTWQETDRAYPSDAAVHRLFEMQAAATPDRVAVVFGNDTVTYRALNRRANRLARRLRALGVERDCRVGLFLEPSVEMVEAMLGILKAGGAYVPLDPGYPKPRLALICDDARLPVIVTREGLHERLPEAVIDAGVHLVCVGRGDVEDGAADENLPHEARSTDLIYVIYTSGSTGTPKGVEALHRGVTRLVINTNYLSIVPSDRIAQASTSTFDAATFEIWGALLHGATLVGIARDVLLSPPTLAAELRRQEITVLFLTTDLFNHVVAEVPDAFASLRALLFGGSAVDPRRVREVLDHGSPRTLLHVYGPTEATTFATWHKVSAVAEGVSTVAIGRPVANTHAYVLDPCLNPLPVGVPGELYLGGDGLARGYLNHPELTAARFVAHPFSERPAARLYRTGDLVRWNADGDLEFVGRLDDQVKIRGFRVEPGEVEAVLRQHPRVREAMVVAREDIAGDKRLVGYFVGDGASPAEELATSLREFCRTRLPQYTIPSAFVSLDGLPLTSTGKVNRAALPAPPSARQLPAETFGEPRTATEKRLQAMWAHLLQLDRVGIHDNFFELGGDSILGIQLVARAKDAGLHFTTKQLFENQTIAELALVTVDRPEVAAEQEVVTGPVPLTPIQRWFFAQGLEEPHHFNQALLLELRLRLDPGHLTEAVRHLLVHHDALRLRARRSDAGWQQSIAEPDDEVPVSAVDLSATPLDDHAAAVETHAAAAQRTLDLSRGPILRVIYFDRGPERSSRLLLVVHHLAVDTVSWRILLEDLWTTYAQRSAGQDIRLPRKTTSFRAWAERLMERLHAETFRQELPYWLGVLAPRVARLPVEVGEGDNVVASTHTVCVGLSSDDTRTLLQEVPRRHRAQVKDVLVAALGHAFARWLDTGQLLLDLEGHGRESIVEGADVTRTVGWFTTVYPVRLDLDQMRDIGRAVPYVKDVMRAIPGHGIGYGALRWLADDETRRRLTDDAPVPEVSFNYLGQLGADADDGAGVRLAPESVGSTRSPGSRRAQLLEIDAVIAEGALRITFTYSKNVHRRATIERLAGDVTAAVGRLVTGEEPAERTVTPGDFPLAQLSERELERIRALMTARRPEA